MLRRSGQMCERIIINKYDEIMKKLNEIYEAPCVEVTEMQVEQSVLSGSYGDAGEPGQDSGYNDPDFDL